MQHDEGTTFIRKDEWPTDQGARSLRNDMDTMRRLYRARMCGVLSDRDIKRALACEMIKVEPLADNAIQPSSVDVRLAGQFMCFKRPAQMPAPIDTSDDESWVIDPYKPNDRFRLPPIQKMPGESIIINPLEFMLGVTVENIELPDDVVVRLDGVSSLGRLGLLIHATAGLVDPGWKGRLTLELFNLSPFPIRLYAGMRIGQLSFFKMSTPVENPYHGKYQGDDTVAASRFYRESAQVTDGLSDC